MPYSFSRSYIKLQGHAVLKIVDFSPNWAFPDCNSSLESPMATKWCTKLGSSIEEVPYCFSRSSIKFQGHIALEIVEFDSNWAFPDCNSSLNSTMAMKCCTKLETAKKRCPIVFQGHPSNFKVTRDKTSPILTQIGRFGLQAGRSFQIPQICLVISTCKLVQSFSPMICQINGALTFFVYYFNCFFLRITITCRMWVVCEGR